MIEFCVYKHTSPTGKVYIGITSQDPPEKRFVHGRGYGKQTVFGKAIKKYGWKNFTHEIILDGLTEKEAKENEIKLIASYKSTDRRYGYNMSKGGDGSPGVKKTPQQIEELSMRTKGENNPFYGRKHTEETKEKIKKSHWSVTGKYSPKPGNKMSEEAKAKMRANHYDVSGENNPRYGKGKPVIRIFPKTYEGVVYPSIRIASDETGITRTTIWSCCNNNRKDVDGYMWEYVDIIM